MALNDTELEFLRESNYIENEWEAAALEDASLAWEQIRDMPRIGLEDILNCHSELMRSRKTIADRDKGIWTRYRTRVGARINPDPIDIPDLMVDFVKGINANVEHHQEGCEEHKQLGIKLEDVKADDAKNYHIKFERIHPFLDGNGRVGRILYNWHRLRLGLPVDVIESKKRKSYYAWFK